MSFFPICETYLPLLITLTVAGLTSIPTPHIASKWAGKVKDGENIHVILDLIVHVQCQTLGGGGTPLTTVISESL